MMLGDIGETAVAARGGELDKISLCLFRPIKFMLATPCDGIRGQLHVGGGKAALYSRTLGDVGHQFPEIVEGARKLGGSLIVDGEVVAFKVGQVPSLPPPPLKSPTLDFGSSPFAFGNSYSDLVVPNDIFIAAQPPMPVEDVAADDFFV